MTISQAKKEVEKLKEQFQPKRGNRIVVEMWLPEDDPRHHMTDSELEKLQPNNRVIIKPLKSSDPQCVLTYDPKQVKK